MEKRFFLFIILSVGIMLGSIILQNQLGLNQKPEEQNADLENRQDNGENLQPGEKPPKEDPVDDENKTTEEPAEKVNTPDREEKQPAEDLEKPAVKRNTKEKLLALGSIDKSSPYRMLAIFSSKGAAVKQIELNHYLDLESKSGYLGYLALENVAAGAGCRVRVVGSGTPAAAAVSSSVQSPGLAPEDVITQFGAEKIEHDFQLQQLLKKTSPGQKIPLSVVRTIEGRETTIEFTVTLGERPAEVIRPDSGDLLEPESRSPPSFLMTLESIDGEKILLGEDEISGLDSLRHENWEMEKISATKVEFRFRLQEQNLEIIKSYELAEVPQDQIKNTAYKAYHLTLNIEIKNLGETEKSVAYQLDGPNGLPLEGWWYSMKIHPKMRGRAGVRDVAWRSDMGVHTLFGCSKIANNATEAEEEEAKSGRFSDPLTPMFSDPSFSQLRYVGVDAQYFSAFMMPPEGAEDLAKYRFSKASAMLVGPVDDTNYRTIMRANVSFRLTSNKQVIPAGKSFEQSFTVFVGPKERDLLAEYDLQDSIVYGWFGFVAKPMLVILHGFHGIVWNYGLAIVMLTVLVRGCMFPLGRKMAKNTQKMQELAPEMKRIAEKYKNDMEKRAKAQQELFKKNNYNPLGGCGLMFFQLPVFIGLYRSLNVAIELRRAPLIPGLSWCSNLAGPDQFWYWEPYLPEFIAGQTGWLGPYLNILPLFTVVLFIVQQKMFSPPAIDEQQKLQQKVMSFMTVFIGIMFFKVPSGLCLYFIISSLWGIGERKFLPKSSIKKEDKPTTLTKAATKPGSNGSPKPSKEKTKKKQKNKRR